MSIIVPSDTGIRQALPQIQGIAMLDTGGFKAVYRVTIGGQTEALKLIQIPASDGSPDAEAFKREMIGRVRREIEALGRCNGPEIVKLGTLALTPVTINAVDYVAYSGSQRPWEVADFRCPQTAGGGVAAVVWDAPQGRP